MSARSTTHGAATSRFHRTLLVVVAVYAFLVGTHRGEFWPLSIFPMFSQAGRPWKRALVRELNPGESDQVRWRWRTLNDLPGKPYALDGTGVEQNHLSGFLDRRPLPLPPEDARLLHTMFAKRATEKTLAVYQIRGALINGALDVRGEPVAIIGPTGIEVAPGTQATP